MKIEAYQIAEEINLRKFKSEYTSVPLFANNYELFYKTANEQYFYLFNYGVVVFGGLNDLEKSNLIKFIKQYTDNEVKETYIEDFTVNIDTNTAFSLKYDFLTVSELPEDVLRIIMLNTAQSVSLDYYEALSLEIFNSTRRFTDELEQKGNLHISKTNLLKFIGKTLNIKNSIIDNLYIFDAPDIVWDNEHLERIDEGLKKTFDLRMRYRDIDYKLKIVQENLTLFTDLLQNRESNRLEWIIIVLILIEVAHVLFQWIF